MTPRIVPRAEHGISRKKISRNALYALYRLRENGFAAYLVGGCVRDLLLERTPKDFDIATNASPGEIKRLFRNCRLIGRRFRLAHLRFADEILEVSTFRAAAPPDEQEGEQPEAELGRVPRHLKDGNGMVLRDNVFGTPEEDALRRDFTINALAYNIADFSVIDYSTGLDDLKGRIIRPIGDPLVRFTEDPVRMIRAVRFAASHDLTIEPVTWQVLCGLSSSITRAAPARLYEEILKLFLLGSAAPAFALLEASGLLQTLFPALRGALAEESGLRKVVQTNLECLDRLSRKGLSPCPALFLATLFGPGLEKEALVRHREGVPHQQALDAACTLFLEQCCKTVSIPGRAIGQMRRILQFQPLLHRMPPRRPSSLMIRPDFADAMSYLYMKAKSGERNKMALEWWNGFLSNAPAEPTGQQSPAKKKRRRRRRGHPAAAAPVEKG